MDGVGVPTYCNRVVIFYIVFNSLLLLFNFFVPEELGKEKLTLSCYIDFLKQHFCLQTFVRECVNIPNIFQTILQDAENVYYTHRLLVLKSVQRDVASKIKRFKEVLNQTIIMNCTIHGIY